MMDEISNKPNSEMEVDGDKEQFLKLSGNYISKIKSARRFYRKEE